MSEFQTPPGTATPPCCDRTAAAIGVVVVIYLITLLAGWPQAGTHAILAAAQHAADTPVETDHGDQMATEPASAAHSSAAAPPLYMLLPFVLLLGAIALFPLLHATEHWWENNLHKLYVALGLAVITLAYYAVLHPGGVERHFLGHAFIPRGDAAVDWQLPWTLVQNTLLGEFIPFIVLLFSLFAITGGIRIQGNLPAYPITNTAFIAVGGVLASFIGTTGAAMLLIRPLLETNVERKHSSHSVVFFIFVVCNCGGCLLPIGDPPLFLGYLQGVDFLWTLHALWQPWLLVNVLLLAIYFLLDRLVYYPREAHADIKHDETHVRSLTFSGLWPNVLLLVGVVAAVGLLDPSKPLPGSDWHAWLYLREVTLLALVGISLSLGPSQPRRANQFNYGAILEVAALFLGIFICMQPALQILNERGPNLGIDTPMEFFWITGGLSSVLDNAPTYLVFFQTARTLPGSSETMAGVPVPVLIAISLGAVFMGANTYIGNGPNFMVKTIAEHAGVRMPSFFGYMVYSGLVLIPIFALVSWIWF